uniref:Ig-like domain-containing protein n=1 Tax=Eptatretus burgeri TaxID=7764 RepID=A0A8C4R645_EPTBU
MAAPTLYNLLATIVVLASVPFPQVIACPPRCDCWPAERAVVCHRRKLQAVPAGIPSETRRLDLSKNKLRTVSTSDLAGLSSLEELDLSDNGVSLLEPGIFADLPGLQRLRLRRNRLKLLPGGVFAGLGNLTHLDVGDNRLVVLLDHVFAGLSALRRLDVGDNELVYVAPRAFAGLSNLQELVLERCNLTSVPSEALATVPQLLSLRLRNFPTTIVLPNSFSRLTALQRLELATWPELESLGPDSLYGLNLTELAVTGCGLVNVPYTALRHLVYLRRLDLSGNLIQTLEPRGLAGLSRLQELRLADGGHLATVALQAFWGLPQLRLLDLSGNQLVTLEEGSFHAVATLALLRLDGNPLSCDCRLLWLLRRRRRLGLGARQPTCAGPEAVRGWEFRAFPDILLPGQFECQAPRIYGDGISGTAAAMTVSEGQTIRITCEADGDPTPIVIWLGPRGLRLKPRQPGRLLVHNDGTLEVRHAQRYDAGAYVCVASNAGGNASRAVRLSVRPHSAVMAMSGATAAHGPPPPRHDDGIDSSLPPPFFGAYPDAFPPPAQPTAALPLSFQMALVAAAMGCSSFLVVVLLCSLLLFFWSRAKGNVKGTTTPGQITSQASAAHPHGIVRGMTGGPDSRTHL